MNILALDLGSHCGWALKDGQYILSGVQLFDLQRGESPGMRYLRFKKWLQIMCDPIRDIKAIYYEQPHNRGGHATALLNGMVAIILYFAAEWQIETCPVHSGTLKKFATGSGSASKDDMIEAAKKFKSDVTDDNEADALYLLAFAQTEIGG